MKSRHLRWNSSTQNHTWSKPVEAWNWDNNSSNATNNLNPIMKMLTHRELHVSPLGATAVGEPLTRKKRKGWSRSCSFTSEI